MRVKRVNPYPIPVAMAGQNGKILKLAPTGFLAETEHPVLVGSLIESSFELPVMNKLIKFSGVVVKTYDHFGGEFGNPQANRNIAEVSFKVLGDIELKYISSFLARIGQTVK